MKDIRSDIREYDKLDIAIEHFNLALREYVRGENLFSVIHLAGAAEEMLGKIAELENRESAFVRSIKRFRSWFDIAGKDTPSNREINKFILHAKNSVKHLNGNEDRIVEFDLNREADELIRRAIENFNQIWGLEYSDELLEYYKYKKKQVRN